MTSIAFLSDTHGYHEHVRVPPSDLLIFAGDYTKSDIGREEARNFLQWLERQPCEFKAFCLGNHDGSGEKWPDLFKQMVEEYAPSAVWLQDSGVTLCGLNLWGSAVTPRFYDWYFNRDRGPDIKRHWDMIPAGTDLLVTHGPPKGFGDWSPYDKIHAGDYDLLDAIKRIKPKVHVSGHFHGGYGTKELVHENGSKTIIINASICDERYHPVHQPWIFEL